MLAACLLATALLAPQTSFAQQNPQQAETFFNEGRALAQAGKYKEACEKFEASQTADPAPGTLIHLADCHEKLEQRGRAWLEFLAASESAARGGRPEWEKQARQRAAALEASLPSVVITIKPADHSRDGHVSLDGRPLPWSLVGVRVPVDPGPHVVEFKRSKGSPLQRPFEATGVSTSQVELAITDEPGTDGRPLVPPEREAPSSSRLPVSIAVGALGLIGLGVGTGFGLVAGSKWKDASSKCPDGGRCADAASYESARAARSAATISTVGFVAGGVLLATGVVLFLTAPSATTSKSSSVLRRLLVWGSPDGAVVGTAGSF